MKRIILSFIICLPILSGSMIAQQNPESKQGAVVKFTDKTRLGAVTLLGTYYFEHDDSRMARGEPCMYVYNYEGGKTGQLITSFHCTPVERPRAKQVVTTEAMTETPDVFQLKEIQFAGSMKGHLV